MIETLRLKNFRAFLRAEIDFGRLTVLVGPNSSGKTSILHALYYVSQVVSGVKTPEQVFSGRRSPEALVRRVPAPAGDAAMQIGCDCRQYLAPTSFPLADISIDFTRPGEPGAKWGMPVTAKIVERDGAEKDVSLRPSPRKPWLKEELEWIRSGVLLRLSTSRLAEPSYYVEEERQDQEGYEGEGLATVLANMALSRPDDFSRLQEAVRLIVPQVKRIRVERLSVEKFETESITWGGETVSRQVKRQYPGEQLVFDMVSGDGIQAHSVSEGTLLALGLLTSFMSSPQPRLLLLDDIDRALHPRAQRDLLLKLRGFLDKDKDLQIVATSHSPYLLDQLTPQEVRITSILDDGTAACAPMTDHPDFNRWKDEMAPGEFWSVIGESWIKDWEKDRRSKAGATA